MENKDFTNVEVVWVPKKDSGKRIKEFWNVVNRKYDAKIENYWELHRWSVENIAEFWKEFWNFTDIIHSSPYESVMELSEKGIIQCKWFKGAKLNIAENMLRHRDDKEVAIYATGEERADKEYTFKELYKESCLYGAALKKLGLKKNDCVVCYMPNREEPVFAMLATTAAGAIWTGALPVLGAQAVLNRFKQANPKFLFSIDRFVNDGEEKNLLKNLKEISHGLPSLEKVIIVPSRPASQSIDISEIRNSCFIEEFLHLGIDKDGSIPDLEFEQLPFDHPIYLSYTSGTTGLPKALIHGSGTILASIRDMWLHAYSSKKIVWLSMSPVGWASWNLFTHLFACKVATVLYEGVPYFKHSTSIWDLTDKYKITNLLLTPSVLDELEKRNFVPGPHNSLASLELVLSGGSVVKPNNFDFVYEKVKPTVLFGSQYGSTEFLGSATVIDHTIPIHKGEINSPSLGTKLCCLNDEGEPVLGELGELVIPTPTPTLLLGIWGDSDHVRCKENYLNKFPGYFATGDIAYINPVTSGIVICGRGDDTLKPKGCRFGSSEIYNVVNAFPEVQNSLCVSQYNRNRDERAVLFLKMKKGNLFTEDLVKRIQKSIGKELSKRHIPEIILETSDIPHNANGKKMEITVKKIINKLPYNADIIVNQECLDFFQDVPGLRGYF